MVYCCAVDCNSRSKTKKTRDSDSASFFRLPKDKHLRKIWLSKVKRDNLPEDVRLCHLHFTEDCFKRDLKNELLRLPQKRILKDDAIPTIFSHTKAPEKRKSSARRSETSSKRQLVENAVENAEQMEQLNFECIYMENSKEIQATAMTKDACTQTEMVQSGECGVQVDIRVPVNEYNESTEYSETNDDNGKLDSSFCPNTTEESETDTDTTHQHEPRGSAFIIYWSSLWVLLQRCLSCASPTKITTIVQRGSALIVYLKCINGHGHTWRSQPTKGRFYIGNISMIAAVLFSSNTFRKIFKYFDILNIPWISKSLYYRIHEKYLLSVTHEAWQKEENRMTNVLRGRDVFLCGDGRFDSPGHNAKYLTYSLFDQDSREVIAFSLTQVSEAGNSNRMEKMGLIKVLTEVKEKDIQIKCLSTDRHIQIRKYMREEEGNIDHQFDVWHFCKSIKMKLLLVSKKKICEEIRPWIKSICNHLWWSCATCENDEIMLREKWTSVIFHVQNKHEWSGNQVFHNCCHDPLAIEEERTKAWLLPQSVAFETLQNIVFDKTILKDLKHLTKFSHTGVLEVYHSLLNKWVPKSTHFSYAGMMARSQLAAIDFNLGCDLQQAKTKDGSYRYNVNFSKVTKTWSAKPIKEQKDFSIFENEVVTAAEVLPMPQYAQLPKNIAPVEKPQKEDIVKKQKSRFLTL